MPNLAPSPLPEEGRGEGKKGRHSILCLHAPSIMPVTTETRFFAPPFEAQGKLRMTGGERECQIWLPLPLRERAGVRGPNH